MRHISKNIFISLLCLSLFSCNQTTSSQEIQKDFATMLNDISSNNITYHSDYLIYYYENTNSNQLITLQRFDVSAKITEDLYDMTAYHYGEELIASYAHLEKDNEGYVSYSDINIHNEVEVKRAIDSNNEEFPWEESVYYNLIKYLKVDDFSKKDESTYTYINQDTSLPINIIHTAVPLSTFDLETFEVVIKDNAIDSFIFKEKESDQAYENCMYGRNITIRFENINTTSIEKIKPYEDKKENDELKSALENIRSKNNYTVVSEGIFNDGSILTMQETFISQTDILQNQYTEEGLFQTGIHTHQNKLYIFETVNDYLLGNQADNQIEISNFIPTFDFSEDVFEYIKTDEEGNKVYRPYQTMSAILDYVDVLSYYSSAYYQPAGDIYFFVKDNQISKIEFPVYLYIATDAVIATNRLTYKNIDSTEITTSTWDKFVTEIPSEETSSWYEDKYTANLEIGKDEYLTLTLGEIFEKCLGRKDAIPFFILDSSVVEVGGNYSSLDKCVYVDIVSQIGIDKKLRTNIHNILIENEFSTSTSRDDIFIISTYKKDDILIEVISITTDDALEIVITLPIGNILN